MFTRIHTGMRVCVQCVQVYLCVVHTYKHTHTKTLTRVCMHVNMYVSFTYVIKHAFVVKNI
jgi:hypothetical protein